MGTMYYTLKEGVVKIALLVAACVLLAILLSLAIQAQTADPLWYGGRILVPGLWAVSLLILGFCVTLVGYYAAKVRLIRELNRAAVRLFVIQTENPYRVVRPDGTTVSVYSVEEKTHFRLELLTWDGAEYVLVLGRRGLVDDLAIPIGYAEARRLARIIGTHADTRSLA